MKRLIVVLALLVPAVGPSLHLCVGAVAAQEGQFPPGPSPERSTPKGEWCQRPPLRSNKAHACGCHAHNCQADPRDPNNHSAHTDPQCLNYCTVTQCQCPSQDCP